MITIRSFKDLRELISSYEQIGYKGYPRSIEIQFEAIRSALRLNGLQMQNLRVKILSNYYGIHDSMMTVISIHIYRVGSMVGIIQLIKRSEENE